MTARKQVPASIEADWLARTETICLERSLQFTPLRREIARIVAHAPQPLGAYAIIEQLSHSQGRQVTPPTVYRTLDFLVENGFVVKVGSRQTYTPCHHLGHDHHGVLLICVNCGRLNEVESDELEKAVKVLAARAKFAPQRQSMEVEGLCEYCAEAA